MTERTYICNVCRAKFDSELIETADEIFGVYFDHENKWIWKTNYECETHICLRCLENASRLHATVINEAAKKRG